MFRWGLGFALFLPACVLRRWSDSGFLWDVCSGGGGGGGGGAGVHAQFSLCLQGPYYWVLKGSRALTMRSLEGSGLFIEEGPLVD